MSCQQQQIRSRQAARSCRILRLAGCLGQHSVEEAACEFATDVLASVPKAAYSRLTFLSFTATVVVFQGFGVCDSLALIVLRVPPARQGLAAGLGDCEMTTLRLEHRGPIINREQTIGPSPIS